ncbi:MAG: DUF2520 domain-containing protein [Deltaproteobacteria bacterium]|nr:DUF2520 domain-containing protein [Deltaproteobacteria bacterium]
MDKPTVAVVGCGTLGTALARLLHEHGYHLAALASRTLASAQEAAAAAPADKVSDKAWEVVGNADVVFLTTSDDAIRQACEQIAEKGGFAPGQVVLHTSGVHASDLLDAARKKGAAAGSMHPMQSFAGARREGNPFEGILVSVEGDEAAMEAAAAIARDLGATVVRVDPAAKGLYHAAAVVASNYLVALLDMAFTLNQAAGIGPEESVTGLFPLIQGTLKNIQANGIPKALTGPIARGDVTTVQKHLKEIQAKTPALLSLYQALGTRTVDVARRKGTIDDQTAGQFLAMFS